VRYQGGNNAATPWSTNLASLRCHLLPSGIFRKGVVNVLGKRRGDRPEKLLEEMDESAAKGISITPENLKVSDRAPTYSPIIAIRTRWKKHAYADAKYGLHQARHRARVRR
jgi:adenylosuccinate synthase